MLLTKKLNPKDKLPLTCTRTGTCCHGKNVNLNPWELICLAKEKGISPKAFRDQYCEFGGIRLRFDGEAGWKGLPACSQYQKGLGCSVHLGRPLACRLYPLGRQKQAEKTHYIYQGSEFPCLEGCPDVVNLPKLSVEKYIGEQGAKTFEIAQDEYLEVMQNLADVAFVLLLETDLRISTEWKTLASWREMGSKSPEQLATQLDPTWLTLLLIPELECNSIDPYDFIHQHNELLQAKAQASFGGLHELGALYHASILMMGLALHLSRSLGAEPDEMADLWINIAKEHGAVE